jgi:hypothetical protein
LRRNTARSRSADLLQQALPGTWETGSRRSNFLGPFGCGLKRLSVMDFARSVSATSFVLPSGARRAGGKLGADLPVQLRAGARLQSTRIRASFKSLRS